eukprot:452303-Prymnesium_polylepis.1
MSRATDSEGLWRDQRRREGARTARAGRRAIGATRRGGRAGRGPPRRANASRWPDVCVIACARATPARARRQGPHPHGDRRAVGGALRT